MQSLESAEKPVILNSWKEIAAYLGKGVRTVQRWEGRLGLPIRRPNHNNQGIVQATREELDEWLRENWSLRDRGESVRSRGDLPAQLEKLSSRANMLRGMEIHAAHPELVHNLERTLSKLITECGQLASNLETFRVLRQEMHQLRGHQD